MSEWKGKYVRFAKVGVQENPVAPTPLWEDYEHGERNPGSSIPLSYWVEGVLITEPQEGMAIVIDRRVRNGEKIYGVLQTSLVSAIIPVGNDSLRIETKNSVYILSRPPAQEYSMSGESSGTP